MANQKFQLQVVSGAPTELVKIFDQNVVTIGRGASSDLRIENGIVSRQHAEVLRSTKGFVLFAQSKTNPVVVDGETVPPDQTAPLSEGSRIVLSKKVVIDFSFVDEGATPSQAEPAAGEGGEPADEAQTDAFSPELLRKVRSSLSSRSEGSGEAPEAEAKPKPAESTRKAPSSGSLSRPTIPLSRGKTEGLLDPPLEATGKDQPPQPGEATELFEPPPNQVAETAASQAPRPRREQNPLLSKLFAKAPEVVEVISGPRPREGTPGAAILVEGFVGQDRVEVYDDLLIGAGADSDVVIQGAYAPRRAAVAVRIGDRYRLYNVSPSAQTVLLNGRAVEGQAALQDGDEVEVYGVRLQVAIPAR